MELCSDKGSVQDSIKDLIAKIEGTFKATKHKG
jgi:hypothetical protein